MTNLVIEVKPENLVSYGKLLVGFFDGFKNKTIDDFGNVELAKDAEPELYIHIQNADDKYSVVRRKIEERFSKAGRRADEKVLFKAAYDKYLNAKNKVPVVDKEKELLKARIAELESKAIKPVVKAKKIENTEDKE